MGHKKGSEMCIWCGGSTPYSDGAAPPTITKGPVKKMQPMKSSIYTITS